MNSKYLCQNILCYYIRIPSHIKWFLLRLHTIIFPIFITTLNTCAISKFSITFVTFDKLTGWNLNYHYEFCYKTFSVCMPVCLIRWWVNNGKTTKSFRWEASRKIDSFGKFHTKVFRRLNYFGFVIEFFFGN